MAKQRKAQAAGPQWRDLRDWLELVDALGELKHVRGASSEEDIGAVTEMLDHTEKAPVSSSTRSRTSNRAIASWSTAWARAYARR